MRGTRASAAIGLALACALPARADLTGDEVTVNLLTQYSGTYSDTSVVTTGPEFVQGYSGNEISAIVDFFGDVIQITYSNAFTAQQSPVGFNLGLLGFELLDLDPAGGEVITDVQVTSSDWPAGTFDDLAFDAHSISIPMSSPVIPAETAWSATLQITTPEPGPAAGAIAGAVGLALRRRRAGIP